jgi:hypothetical protein
MTNLAHRPPLGLKAAPPRRDKAMLDRIRALPCVICNQPGPSHAHHVISGRYSQRKAGDDKAIPLCWNHHQGPEGIHTNKAAWEAAHGPDTGFLPMVADILAGV